MANPPESIPEQFTVTTWNMLLDITRTRNHAVRSQANRLPKHIATLAQSGLRLDVVGIQEAHEDNGRHLAEALGFDESFWFQHNLPSSPRALRGRTGEYVGVFGHLVHEAEPIEIGDQRLAVKTMIGDVAVVNFHLRHEYGGKLGTAQSRAILDAVKDEERVVLMGDSNKLWHQQARRQTRREGFDDVFKVTGQARPVTFPSDDYYDVMLGRNTWKQRLMRNGVSIDMISVRGLHVVSAGTLREVDVPLEPVFDESGNEFTPPTGASDHVGLWATLARDLRSAA